MIPLIICSDPEIIMRIHEHAVDLNVRHIKWESLLMLLIKHILSSVITEKTMLLSIYQDFVTIAIDE